MLILIGDKDYNDASRCKKRVEELRADGADVDLVIYPNAYHCFLASFPVKLVNTPVYRDCGTKVLYKEMGYAGRINVRVRGAQCVKKQGMCGGNYTAQKDALERVVGFFTRHL